ncbi:hypothetical protein A3J34_00485 [Candidatus Peribacteria bacterium RIFCSPLOWO2_02_FULL_51_10]|nr:MAG: hypothetical protein A3J34_00485 [Candidatus Peribacteria bacterium RIFCSPLOWO2_02_FULL_51_10]
MISAMHRSAQAEKFDGALGTHPILDDVFGLIGVFVPRNIREGNVVLIFLLQDDDLCALHCHFNEFCHEGERTRSSSENIEKLSAYRRIRPFQ